MLLRLKYIKEYYNQNYSIYLTKLQKLSKLLINKIFNKLFIIKSHGKTQQRYP